MKFSPGKLSVSLIFLIFLSALLYAQGGQANRKSLNKTSDNSWPYAHMNINNISTLIHADGQSDINLLGNGAFVYPKESGKTVVFESGLLWGGIVNNEIRVNGAAYTSGLRPGRILPGLVPEDPSKARLYRVRRDYKTADLTAETNDKEGTQREIRERYDKDWKDWPASDGAPYEDVNYDGKYDPSVDIPGEQGSDMTIWFVANDLDEAVSKGFLGSKPIGIEMQCTVYAFRNPGSIKNVIFKKYKIINKSTDIIKSMYIMTWSDFDIGDATNDFAGCDTLLNLGYTYNAVTSDAVYGDTPPAGGFEVMQGPIVEGSASDTAHLNNRKLPGMKNLPMTSFSDLYFYQGGPDPLPVGPAQYYNFMQGKTANGFFYPVPAEFGGGITRFPLSGDPVNKTGFLDGIQHPKGDRRMGVSSGPFTMAPGDTQEVVFAEIAAGASSGISNTGAVSALKNSAFFAKEFYKNNWNGKHPVESPVVSVNGYDREVVLNWSSDMASVNRIESCNYLTQKFEGYNIYQLPYPGANICEGKRIAVFDLIDSIKAVYGRVVNFETGTEDLVAQQFGTDSGIQRYLRINEDAYSKQPLINGKKYYFAVTSYIVNPEMDPSNMESAPTYVEAVPHANDPGVVYNSSFGDTLKVSHISGKSDGKIIPLVVDPAILTGDEYQVEFESVNSQPVWKVVDVTKNKTVLSNQTALSEGEGFPVADGILFKVINPSPGVKPDDMYSTGDSSMWGWRVTAGQRRFSWSGADGLELEGFRGAIGSGKTWLGSSVGYDKMKSILIRLAAADRDGNVYAVDEDVSYAYRYVRGADLAPAKDVFVPFITNKSAGYAFQDFKRNFPFAAYDIDDPHRPRRLEVGYLENNSSGGLLDGKYWPGKTGTDNISADGPREWFFIFDTDYQKNENPALKGNLLAGTMPVLLQGTVNRNSDSWSGGDELAIYVNHIFSPDDKFTFKSIAPVFSTETAKADVDRINVFPNPYYGAYLHEANSYQRFVTFSHLPKKATIRIFNLAGQVVRTIHKDTLGQFAQWDLLNEYNVQTASGMFLVHIDMPDLGKSKILKLAVIQEQMVPDRY